MNDYKIVKKNLNTIDFDIYAGDIKVASIYGDDLTNLEIECDHLDPEFGDIEELGTCPVCGMRCHWHRESDPDCGYDSDGSMVELPGGSEVIDEWDYDIDPDPDAIIPTLLNKIKERK